MRSVVTVRSVNACRQCLQSILWSAPEQRGGGAAELIKAEQAKVLGFTPPGEDSLAELATRCLAHQRVRLTAKSYERVLLITENHLKVASNGPVQAIRRVDVPGYTTPRSGKVSTSSVSKELTTLKHTLSLAVEWEIIPFSPAQGVKAPKLPAGRVRFLQPTELRAVLEACPQWLRPIVGLVVSTGMRRGETLGLRWLDVDMEHKCLLLPQTKNGEGRIVHLSKRAMDALRSVLVKPDAKATDRLFPGVSPEKVSMAFQRAIGTARIADFHSHDLRHKAASWLRMQGADIQTLAQILGHKHLRMAARYQHLSPAFMAEAIGRLDSVFDVESPLEVPKLPPVKEPVGATA